MRPCRFGLRMLAGHRLQPLYLLPLSQQRWQGPWKPKQLHLTCLTRREDRHLLLVVPLLEQWQLALAELAEQP